MFGLTTTKFMSLRLQGLSWLLPSSILSFLLHILLLLAWDMSLLFPPFRPTARVFACSHKHFDYLGSSTSSGKIIMGFHELLQMDCVFELRFATIQCKILLCQLLDLNRSHSQHLLTEASQKKTLLTQAE